MKYRVRFAITIIVALLAVGAHTLYSLTQSPVAGVATSAQLNDTVSASAAAKFIAQNGVPRVITLSALALIALTWIGLLGKKECKCGCGQAAAALALCLFAVGCGPAKVLDPIEIKPNETAWSVPLDAMSKDGQTKFNSVGFLDARKVAAKRIMMDKVCRSTGRMWYDYEWIPAALVVKVDRSLVTREWTFDSGTGTSVRNEGIKVITKDNIELILGLTTTVNIEEDDASTYLYYHGDKPLAIVVDTNVRSFAVAELTRKYGAVSLTEAQNNQAAIYAEVFADAKTFFKAKGVTIQYLGNADGWRFVDSKIQDGINKRYMAEMDKQTALQEQGAQITRNATLVMNSQAQADSAKKLLEAREATTLQNQLNIDLITAQARKTWAEKWDGKLPANMLPSNSPMLMNVSAAGAAPKPVAATK